LLPAPLVASNVCTRYVSDRPGGDGGPLTVQGHVAGEMFEVTLMGERPTGGFVIVIVTDAADAETRCGVRPRDELAALAAGKTIVNVGVTSCAGGTGTDVEELPDVDAGTPAGCEPPPPHAARPNSAAKVKNARMTVDRCDCIAVSCLCSCWR
jgi:hypothetical protein